MTLEGSREDLIGAACRDCGTPLTPEQVELGADMFMCECGGKEIRCANGDSLMETDFS